MYHMQATVEHSWGEGAARLHPVGVNSEHGMFGEIPNGERNIERLGHGH